MEQYGETEIAKVCWEIDPDVVITRGAIQTPEQTTPDTPMQSPWEACYTLGEQWQYRPTNEEYKSAKETITQLIDIRAKGGNFLLNFGPDAEGLFPPEQLGVLNEIALWMFINREGFEKTWPAKHIREGNIWFQQNEKGTTAYLFIIEEEWKFGERKTFQLESLKADSDARISVLGHNGKVLEYSKDVDPLPRIKNTDKGVEISVMRAQRIYNDRKWNNPVVVKIEGVVFK
jgi:alpha-L-fucosidase